MIKNTEGLIKNLAQELPPVQPLPGPPARTLLWLAILFPYVGLVVLIMGFVTKRPISRLDTRFVAEQIFALSTGIAAAMAAFVSVIPGRKKSFLLWPLLPMAGWLGTLGAGCLQTGGDGTLHHNLWCFPYIIILGTAPALILWTMLRRGAPLHPHMTAALGAIAAAGVGNFCVRLVHPEDVTVMLMVWHVGGVFLLTAVSSRAGRYMLNWGFVRGVFRSAGR
jgi:hypothetical protein